MNATQYMEHWQKNKVWTHLLWPKHQRRFELCAGHCLGESFIDVGCAYGHSTEQLARFRPGAWAGMDFDRGAIIAARQLYPEREFIFSADYDMRAAADGRKWDSIVCSEVIEHVPDDAGFIRGLAGIAGRRIILTTPNRRVSDPGHLRIYTEKALAVLLRDFKREIISDGPFFYAVVNLES